MGLLFCLSSTFCSLHSLGSTLVFFDQSQRETDHFVHDLTFVLLDQVYLPFL